jgi:CRP/FNR family cyclic AMP-dependent transcriptional regulator
VSPLDSADIITLQDRNACSAREGTLTDEIITALQQSEMFRDLPTRELRRIRDAGKELSFASGSELVVEGEEAGRFFLILTGSAEVTLNGKKRGTLEPGMSLGEIALLDGGPRSATVTAVTVVRTFSLASWNFRPFLADESVMQAVIQLLCKRLRSAEEAAYR